VERGKIFKLDSILIHWGDNVNKMIFERDGNQITSDVLSELASLKVSEFLHTLQLNGEVEIYSQEILTTPREAKETYGFRLFQKKTPEERSRARDIKAKKPFCYNGRIFTPLLSSRRAQEKYWQETLMDLWLYASGIQLKAVIESGKAPSVEHIDGVFREVESYTIQERIRDPNRAGYSPGYAYFGESLPNDTFTLAGFLHENTHLALGEKLGIGLERCVSELVCVMATIYSNRQSLPIVMKHFGTFKFPDELLEHYGESINDVKWVPKNEHEKKTFALFNRLKEYVDGNFIDALDVVGSAVRCGMRHYEEVYNFFNK
jgi:hypothetical protein